MAPLWPLEQSQKCPICRLQGRTQACGEPEFETWTSEETLLTKTWWFLTVPKFNSSNQNRSGELKWAENLWTRICISLNTKKKLANKNRILSICKFRQVWGVYDPSASFQLDMENLIFLTVSKIFLSGVKKQAKTQSDSFVGIGIWLNLVGIAAQTASGSAAFSFLANFRPAALHWTGLYDRVDQGKTVVRERHRQDMVFRNRPEGPPGWE